MASKSQSVGAAVVVRDEHTRQCHVQINISLWRIRGNSFRKSSVINKLKLITIKIYYAVYDVYQYSVKLARRSNFLA